MKTYRYKGHSMSDPRKYRTREEEEHFESGDPIGKLRDAVLAAGVIDEAAFTAMQKEVREEVRESIRWSDESPLPGLEELYHDVYVEKWGPYTGTSDPDMLREGGER
jgi:pyruvate dehydrogenase E1 component alpha subunit